MSLIGCGTMGLAHLKVLKDLDIDDIIVWAPSKRNQEKVNELGYEINNEHLDSLLNKKTNTCYSCSTCELFI